MNKRIDKNKIKKRKREIIGCVLVAMVLFSVCFEFFNLDYLHKSPFESSLKWESPLAAAANDEGYTAVIDSVGTRVSLISPERKVAKVIRYSMFSDNSPSYENDVSLGKDTITVVDRVTSDEYEGRTYDRILVYDFDGKYIEEAYSDENDADITVYTTAAEDDRIYVAATDDGSESVIIGKIEDGKIDTVHEYSWDGDDVFSIRYTPSSDMTTLLTCKGDVVTWQGEKKAEHCFSETDVTVSDAVSTGDGELVVIEDSTNAAIEFDSKGKRRALACTEAHALSVCGTAVICPDQNNDVIDIIDRSTGTVDEMGGIEYSGRIRLMCFITWFVLVMGIAALTVLIIASILIVAANIRKAGRSAGESDTDDDRIRPLTNLRLYGPMMGIAALAFAITAIMLGGMFFNSAVETSEASITNISGSISGISGDSFGDSMKKIEDQSDYGSYDYYRTVGYAGVACAKNMLMDSSAYTDCSLYNFNENSDEIIVVFDASGQTRTGIRMSLSDQKESNIDRYVKSIKEGNMEQGTIKFSNGVSYYESLSPVYDSEGSVIGLSRISFNQTKFKRMLLQNIMMKLVQAFTLLFGLVLMFVEFGLAGRFFRIKKQNNRNGLTGRTVPEAFRTMDVVFRIPAALFIIFINSMVDEVLDSQLQQETIILMAIPVTVYAVAFFVFRLIMGHYVKYSPRSYAHAAAAVIAASSLVLLMAMKMESYLLLNAGAVALGFGSATGLISAKSIRLALTPSAKYNYIVIERKGLIASAIAASIGTVIRAMFGKTAIIYFMIFIAIAAAAAASLFMENDINLSGKREKAKKSVREFLNVSRTMLRNPGTFAFMILVALPLPFLTLLVTYALPQVVRYYGLPEVFVGAISIIVSAVTLLVVPFVWKIVNQKKDEHWPPAMMGALAVMLLLFSLITTMRLFVLVLIFVALCESILMPLTFRHILNESVRKGYDTTDTSPMHEFFLAIGALIGPAIMTATIMTDVKLIGLIWGIVCAICAIAAAVLFKKHRTN